MSAWNHVDEALPDKGEEVLGWDADKDEVVFTYLVHPSDPGGEPIWDGAATITHWMPKPTPPHEVEDETDG